MRKLLLFGLLGAIFGSALLLEQVFSRGSEPAKRPPNKAVLLVGGGAPRPAEESDGLEVIVDEPVAEARTKGKKPEERDAPRPEPEPSARTRKVAARDTLWTIAAAELGGGARYQELAAWNGLDADAPLKVGMTLRLTPPAAKSEKEASPPKKMAAADPPATPRHAAADAPRTHKVAKGETLSKIAARYLGDAGRWREIQSLNKIADPAAIDEGSVLEIPEK
jgi:nucleoid-associated protein YgaU